MENKGSTWTSRHWSMFSSHTSILASYYSPKLPLMLLSHLCRNLLPFIYHLHQLQNLLAGLGHLDPRQLKSVGGISQDAMPRGHWRKYINKEPKQWLKNVKKEGGWECLYLSLNSNQDSFMLYLLKPAVTPALSEGPGSWPSELSPVFPSILVSCFLLVPCLDSFHPTTYSFTDETG